jgi:hypothetical protein
MEPGMVWMNRNQEANGPTRHSDVEHNDIRHRFPDFLYPAAGQRRREFTEHCGDFRHRYGHGAGPVLDPMHGLW